MANRDLNAQFENAEEANAELIKQKKEQMKAELDALDASVKNAKANITAQKEQTQSYKDEIEERSKSDLEIAKQNEKIIKDELKLFKDQEGVYNMSFKNASEQANSRLNQADHFNNLMKNMNLQNMEDVDNFIEKMKEEQNAIISHMKTEEDFSEGSIRGMKKRFEQQSDMIDTYRSNIERKLLNTSENINSITEEQIETSEQSALASQNIIDNSANKRLEIEQRYAKENKNCPEKS